MLNNNNNNNELRTIVCCECGSVVEIDLENASSIEMDMYENDMCMNCFYEKFAYCECCEEYYEIDNMTTVERCSNGETMLVCDSCLNGNANIFWCEYHECYEFDNFDDYIVVENYGDICQNAYDYSGNFSWCEECGNCFHIDDTYWDEDTECNYCVRCYEEVVGDRVIKGYHNHKDDYEYSKLMTSEESKEGLKGLEGKCFYGMEIEIEGVEYRGWGYTDKEEVAKKLDTMNNSFAFENDGSLNYGFEMISYPFTKAYMDKHLSNQLESMIEVIKEEGFGVKESCGLHFHVTKINNTQVSNLIYLTEYFRNEFIELSKREIAKLNRWAKFHTTDIAIKSLTKNVINDCVRKERYSALNISNRKTVEFRFFNGTIDHMELMARYEMIYNINEYALENELNDSLDNMPNFLDLITYKSDEYVSEYLMKEFPRMITKAFTQVKTTN